MQRSLGSIWYLLDSWWRYRGREKRGRTGSHRLYTDMYYLNYTRQLFLRCFFFLRFDFHWKWNRISHEENVRFFNIIKSSFRISMPSQSSLNGLGRSNDGAKTSRAVNLMMQSAYTGPAALVLWLVTLCWIIRRVCVCVPHSEPSLRRCGDYINSIPNESLAVGIHTNI